MKKLAVLMLVFTTIFFMSTSVYAAGAGIGKGSTELFLNGNLIHTDTKTGGDTTKIDQFSYLVGGGYFLTDGLQVGLSHLGTVIEAKNGGKITLSILTFDAFAKYYFYSKGQTVVPYVGIQGGWVSLKAEGEFGGASGEYSKGVGSYGAMGGLKFFLTENVTFNTELNYRHYDFTVEDTTVKVDQTALLLGFSFYF
jgi:hypothetical protein